MRSGTERISRPGRWMAAVLALRARRRAQSSLGGALWGIGASLREPSVDVDGSAQRARSSKLDSPPRLRVPPDERDDRVRRIPVTTVPRTIFDLAATVADSIGSRAPIRQAGISASSTTGSRSGPGRALSRRRGVPHGDPRPLKPLEATARSAQHESPLGGTLLAVPARSHRPAAASPQRLDRCVGGRGASRSTATGRAPARSSSSTAGKRTARAPPSGKTALAIASLRTAGYDGHPHLLELSSTTNRRRVAARTCWTSSSSPADALYKLPYVIRRSQMTYSSMPTTDTNVRIAPTAPMQRGPPRDRRSGPRPARGDGPLAARPRRALRRQRADALPGRAGGDEPDPGGGRARSPPGSS